MRIPVLVGGLAGGLAMLAGCSAGTGDDAGVASAVVAAPASAVTTNTEIRADSPLVLVAYDSRTGMTGRMAEAVAEGARESGGVRVVLARIDSVETADLLAADAILLGSPTHWANMSTAMRAFIDSWPERGVVARDRIGGVFATGGGSAGGKEMVMTSMILAMLNNGMIVVGPIYREGDVEYGNFGVAATTGLMANQSLAATDLDAARGLGRRVAGVVTVFRGRS